MRITNVQNQVLAFLGCTVTNTVDLEGLGESFGYADDHVVDEGTGQAVEGSVHLVVIGTGDVNDACFDFDFHSGCYVHLKCALGALDGNVLTVNLNFHSCRDGNGSSTDS